jgi:uncharacterized membrane protein
MHELSLHSGSLEEFSFSQILAAVYNSIHLLVISGFIMSTSMFELIILTRIHCPSFLPLLAFLISVLELS